MADKPASTRRGGRPLKERDDSQPGAAHLSARVRPEIRRALVHEAGRTGRTVSQTTESMLDAALRGIAETRDLACAEGLRRLIRYARTIQDQVGSPELDLTAWAALHAGMVHLARNIMPAPPVAQAEEARFRILLAELSRRLPKLAVAVGEPALGLALPSAEAFIGTEQTQASVALRTLRGWLHDIRRSRDDEHGVEAAMLERHVGVMLAFQPWRNAAEPEALGRDLASAILGADVGAEGWRPQARFDPP